MRYLAFLAIFLSLLAIPARAEFVTGNGGSGSGGSGVSSINSATGAFTFTGSGVSCSGITCTFTGGSGAVSSVTGTAGEITVSPTTGAVVVSLPSTITPATTFTNGITLNGTLNTTFPMGSGGAFYSGGTAANAITTTAAQFAGSSGNMVRLSEAGSTSTVLTANYNYSALMMGANPITTASTGTHSWLVNTAINPIGTITSGGAAVTNTATMYVAANPQTIGTNNYGLYVADDVTGTVFNSSTINGYQIQGNTGLWYVQPTITCVGPGTCTLLTSASNNDICIGPGACAHDDGKGYSVQIDPEGADHFGGLSVQIGAHSGDTWSGQDGVFIGEDTCPNAGNDNDGGMVVIGSKAGDTYCNGHGPLILIGGNGAFNYTDTTSSGEATNAVLVGSGLIGATDTVVGWGAYASTIADNLGTAALGYGVLAAVTNGPGNTALGEHAGNHISTGGPNTILGANVASTTLATGSDNIMLGVSSAIDASSSSESNSIHVGGTGGDWVHVTGTNTNSTEATTMNGTLAITSTVQVGTVTPQTGTELTISNASSTVNATTYGFYSGGALSAASTGAQYGGLMKPTYTATGTLAAQYGMEFQPQNASTGTISELEGVQLLPGNISTGTVTDMKGFYIQPFGNTGSTTTTYTALYLDVPAGSGTFTTKWGVYENDSGAANYFNGAVDIGTTTPVASAKLTVSGGISQTTATTCSSGVTTNAAGLFNGCVASDGRLKNVVNKAIDNALSIVLNIPTHFYTWKDKDRDDREHYGFIAQEVQKAFPDAVVGGGKGLLAVDPNAMNGLLFKAVQEQQKEIEDLKSGHMICDMYLWGAYERCHQ